MDASVADSGFAQFQSLFQHQQSAVLFASLEAGLGFADNYTSEWKGNSKIRDDQIESLYIDNSQMVVSPISFKPLEISGNRNSQNYVFAYFAWIAPAMGLSYSTLDSFCNDSEGWGPWNQNFLDLTPCFELSFLAQIPRIALLLFGSARLYTLLRSSSPSIPSSLLLRLKTSISIILLLTSLSYLLALIFSPDASPRTYHYIDSGMSILTSIFTFFLIRLEHMRSRSSSTVLLLTWLFMLIADTVVMRTFFLRISLDSESVSSLLVIETVARTAQILEIFVLFVLENIAKPKSYYISLDEDPNQTPEETANIFSRLTFHWIHPIMKLGYTKDLEMEDLWALKHHDTSHYNSESFNKAWNAELKKKHPSLIRALFHAYGLYYSYSVFFKTIHDICAFLQPLYLRFLIAFAASWALDRKLDPQPLYQGFAIAVIMFLTAVLQTTVLHQYFHIAFISGMRIRGAVVAAIYRKAMRLSNSARQQSTVGEIVNLMSVDASKLMDTVMYLNILWSAPFQITLAIVLLYQTLGLAIFAGVGVMLLMIPINAWIVSATRKLNKIQMKNKDNRTKLMDEVLNGIKVIKLYAWEQSFLRKITGVREAELSTLKKIGYLSALSSFTWSATPFLVSFLSFVLYSVISTEPLTSTKIFVSLSLFNLLQFPLAIFPSVVTSLVEASVSMERLKKFLLNQELDRNAVIHDNVRTSTDGSSPNTHAMKMERVSVRNATFGWTESGSPILKKLNFSVFDKTLLSICGRVGSGKSSILSALLGEMYKHDGEVHLRGSIAFVPQTAWIMNQTVRENIIFGKRFDPAFYEQTISACGLQPDLEILPAGDLTEIGERGINLSGGQKQRISLARAVYARADVYLLDDPLSAVDAHVGAHIFDKVLGPRGLLKDKCRILVTHAIQFIPQSDLIINLMDGEICEIGTYENLMAKDSCTKALLRDYGKRKDATSDSNEFLPHVNDESSANENTASDVKPERSNGNITSKEESAKGAVSWDVYIAYSVACGIVTVIWYLLMAITSQIFSLLQNLYLADWATANDRHQRSKDDVADDSVHRLIVYGALGFSGSFLVIFQVIFVWVFCAIRSARQLHEGMLKNVLRAPQSFFDVTPLGRIINRFSKDQYIVDEVLPRTFQQFFRTFLNVLSVLVVNAIGSPLFLLFSLPLGFLYYHFQRFYLTTSRELKRLDSTSRSPIYAHFSETLGGVATIRAYGQENRFIMTNEEKVDVNQKAYYASISSNRWLAVRLEFIGSLIVFGSAFFAVAAIYIYGTISASVVGLMLTYSLNVTQTLNWLVRQSCEIETNIVSVERIKEYSEIPREAPEHNPSHNLPESWPVNGMISFKNYTTRYREGLDLVLKDISFEVQPREKIGIVGRTGAGKSSLTLALFRMIEPTSGQIIIDGEDLSNIGLYDLRSRLTIIPQDPVLFAGTVRSNLDPFSMYEDKDIWAALASASLKDNIIALDGQLEATVLQNGENFSVGQRQLICLARALLRKTKILLLDEATAAIDVETDEIIQKTIRKEFADCTTLTIAHRINTVMDCDRILVLEKGKVVEFDSPANLLENRRSIFYSLAKEAGMTK